MLKADSLRRSRVVPSQQVLHFRNSSDSAKPPGLPNAIPPRSARSSFSDGGQDRCRNPEAGLAQANQRCIEIDQPRLIGLVENGEGAGHLESPARRFLPPSPFINEQHFRSEERRV